MGSEMCIRDRVSTWIASPATTATCPSSDHAAAGTPAFALATGSTTRTSACAKGCAAARAVGGARACARPPCGGACRIMASGGSALGLHMFTASGAAPSAAPGGKGAKIKHWDRSAGRAARTYGRVRGRTSAHRRRHGASTRQPTRPRRCPSGRWPDARPCRRAPGSSGSPSPRLSARCGWYQSRRGSRRGAAAGGGTAPRACAG